jgi:tetratricopeptide (TPR) repeat protein
MRLSKVVVPLLAAALYLGSAPVSAQAQPVNDQLRATARALGEEGITLFEKGRYAEALDRFERADALVHAPTLGLLAARSLEKLGRLVEAAERYRGVTLVQLDAKAPDAFKEAQTTASKELEAVRARIPTLEIVVEGPGAEQATVSVDGTEVPKAIVGVRTPINPGVHRIEAETPTASAVSDMSIDEKQAARAVLTLVPKETTPPPGGDGKQPPSTTSKAPLRRTLGFVSLGVGGAFVVMGIAGAVYAANNRAEVAELCKEFLEDGVRCELSGERYKRGEDARAGYKTGDRLAVAGFVVGGIGLAAGVALILTAPKAPAQTNKAHIEPWIGLGSAGLRGTF